jgi:hypothetical protein
MCSSCLCMDQPCRDYGSWSRSAITLTERPWGRLNGQVKVVNAFPSRINDGDGWMGGWVGGWVVGWCSTRLRLTSFLAIHAAPSAVSSPDIPTKMQRPDPMLPGFLREIPGRFDILVLSLFLPLVRAKKIWGEISRHVPRNGLPVHRDTCRLHPLNDTPHFSLSSRGEVESSR